jgi:hypothetical protein
VIYSVLGRTGERVDLGRTRVASETSTTLRTEDGQAWRKRTGARMTVETPRRYIRRDTRSGPSIPADQRGTVARVIHLPRELNARLDERLTKTNEKISHLARRLIAQEIGVAE